jgi:hypothetical protein
MTEVELSLYMHIHVFSPLVRILCGGDFALRIC